MTGPLYRPPDAAPGSADPAPSALGRTLAVIAAVLVGVLPAVAVIWFALSVHAGFEADRQPKPSPYSSTYPAPPAGGIPNPFVSPSPTR